MNELRLPLFAAILIVSATAAILNWATQRPAIQAAPEVFSVVTLEEPPPPLIELDLQIIHASSTRSFALSPEMRTNEEFGVELLRIGPDGTTTIRATTTGKQLSAKTGECFASEEFGRSGLLLEAAFPSSGAARFTRFFCETITKNGPQP